MASFPVLEEEDEEEEVGAVWEAACEWRGGLGV
jgi:hypothetical protein